MLRDPNSSHWSECQKFIQRIIQSQSRNLSLELKEEIVQSAMLSVVRYLPAFRFDCKLATWLVKIAHHRIIDAYRKEPPDHSHHSDDYSPFPNVYLQVSDEDEENEAYISHISSEKTAEEECVIREELRDAFNDLQVYLSNRKYAKRNIHVMEMHFEGFSQKEIARKLDMPTANVGYVIRSTQIALREQRKQRKLREQK